jgi:Flp pilus assembly protein CpaB
VAVSAQRRRRVLVAVVAALIAAGAFYLAIEYTNKTPATGSGTTSTGTAPPITTATVVEASADIPVGTLLSATNLKTAAVSTDVLNVLTTAGGVDYPNIAALTASKEYAASTIVAGLPILSSELTTTPAAAAAAVAGLPAVLPSGYVAFALPYNPAASSGTGVGTGGFIQTGDRIDILVNTGAGGSTYWAYENVLVLALGQSTGAPVASSSASPAASSSAAPAAAPDLVMVELSRQDAAAMAAVEDNSWTIQYLIASTNDYPSASASPVPAIGAGPGTVTAPNNFFGG